MRRTAIGLNMRILHGSHITSSFRTAENAIITLQVEKTMPLHAKFKLPFHNKTASRAYS